MEKRIVGKDFTLSVTDARGYISVTGSYDGWVGAVGDRVGDAYPELCRITSMHLADAGTGAHINAISNAKHFIERFGEVETNMTGEFVDPFMEDGGDYISEDYRLYLETFDDEGKVVALAKHLDTDVLNVVLDAGDYYCAQGKLFLVVTDEEAEKYWDDELNNYIEECLDIPDIVRNYFDEEAWKRDARFDGRGHSLGSYDGNEYAEEVGGVVYYIYRQ